MVLKMALLTGMCIVTVVAVSLDIGFDDLGMDLDLYLEFAVVVVVVVVVTVMTMPVVL